MVLQWPGGSNHGNHLGEINISNVKRNSQRPLLKGLWPESWRKSVAPRHLSSRRNESQEKQTAGRDQSVAAKAAWRLKLAGSGCNEARNVSPLSRREKQYL